MGLLKFVMAMAVVGAATTGVGVARGRVTGQSITGGFKPEGELWYPVGDAFVNSEFVRLVPDRQSKRGGFWCKDPIRFSDWEVEFAFRIHGVSAVGADGLAFWYSRTPGQLGTLFGHEELYDGLGVVVDTYDNEGTGVHPYIFAMHNDGHHRFAPSDHDHRKDHVNPGYDGANVFGELNGCSARIRNTREPVLMNVRYLGQRLTVTYKLESAKEWSSCFEVPKITLPSGYYFGFSAATGDLADDHDIMRVTVTDLQSTQWSRPLQASTAAGTAGTAQAAAANAGLGAINAKLNNVVELVRDALASTVAGGGDNNNGEGSDVGKRVSELETSVADLKAKLNAVIAKNNNAVLGLTAVDAQVSNAKKIAVEATRAMNGGSGGFTFFLLICFVGSSVLAFYYAKQYKKEHSKKMF